MQGYVAAVFAAILFAASGGAESAAQPSSPYAIDVSVLTGPQGGELTIDVDAAAGTAGAQSFDHVHVSLRSAVADEKILNLNDVPAPNGVATIELGPLERGAAVGVMVQVRGEQSPRTVILRGDATARLRPDLVVAAVHAPPQTLTTRPVDVVADVDELNGETGAKATAHADARPDAAGGAEDGDRRRRRHAVGHLRRREARDRDVHRADRARRRRRPVRDRRDEQRTQRARSRSPSTSSSARTCSSRASAATAPSSTSTSTRRSRPTPPATLPDLEAKVKALEPQLVRIFFNDDSRSGSRSAIRDSRRSSRPSSLRTEAGATINITYQTAANAKPSPTASWREFAASSRTLCDAGLHERPLGHDAERAEHHVRVTLEQYDALYRALDAQLVARGLRDHIGLMGGDLVETQKRPGSNHRFWFDYIAENMNDVLDAYSVHIYWNYWDIAAAGVPAPGRPRDRHERAPEAARGSRSYIMEFGVRGIANIPGQADRAEPRLLARTARDSRGRTSLRSSSSGSTSSPRSSASAARSSGMRTGAATTPGYRRSVLPVIGPADEGWPLLPAVPRDAAPLPDDRARLAGRAGRARGRRATGAVDMPVEGHSSSREKEIAAYAGPNGELTLLASTRTAAR